jgi:hypothetical protein
VVNWIIVVATVVVVGLLVVLLVRQGTPGRLSQHTGDPRPRTTDRPAGPDAETMAPPGEAEGRASWERRSKPWSTEGGGDD